MGLLYYILDFIAWYNFILCAVQAAKYVLTTSAVLTCDFYLKRICIIVIDLPYGTFSPEIQNFLCLCAGI